MSGLSRLLDLAPPIRRARVWAWLLRGARPRGPRDLWRLAVSAALDILLYSLRPGRRPVPRAWKTLKMVLRRTGVVLEVRGGTDDIYHALPGREADVHDTILGLLEPGDTFVDVGANIGYYTILGSHLVGDGGRVVALEPVPETAATLRRNVEANGRANVTVVEAAATDGTVDSVAIAVPGSHFGRAAIGPAQGDVRTVPARTLDDACSDVGAVRLIKLDVEGHELAALRGAESLPERTEFVVLECNEDEAAIEAWLMDRGFRVTRLGFTTHRLAHRDPLAERSP